MKRQKLQRKHSKKVFKGGAQRVHGKNRMQDRPMRGGIRL